MTQEPRADINANTMNISAAANPATSSVTPSIARSVSGKDEGAESAACLSWLCKIIRLVFYPLKALKNLMSSVDSMRYLRKETAESSQVGQVPQAQAEQAPQEKVEPALQAQAEQALQK